MNSPEFGSPEHNREEHRTTEADDEIAKVLPTKFSLRPGSQAQDTAIGMQHPSGKHMLDNIRSVVIRRPIRMCSKPIIQIAQSDAFFLQR